MGIFQRPLDKVWSTCGGNKDAVDKKLLSWYVEAVLKEKYSAFVAALDVSGLLFIV